MPERPPNRMAGLLLGLALVSGAPLALAAAEPSQPAECVTPTPAEPAEGVSASPAAPAPLTAERKSELAEMVYNDCGACHGGRLHGGLGTALVPEALGGKSADDLADVIFNGIPDTAMPPWSRFLTREEALWIAQQLKKGTADVRR